MRNALQLGIRCANTESFLTTHTGGVRMPKPNNTIQSLLSKTTQQLNGCWEWTLQRNPKGYGVVSWQGKSKRVHRVVFEHYNGPIPEGMQVCHRCDNPPCCNPDHLFSGLAIHNEQDKIAKGRHRNKWTGPMTPDQKKNCGPSRWTLDQESDVSA